MTIRLPRTLPGQHGSVILVAAAIAILAGLFTGGCSTLPPSSGPTVAVRNDSDAPLRVRFWIGDRRQQAAGSPLDMTGDQLLEIPPYGVKQYSLSAFSPYQSPTQSFIRVQVEPIGPSFQMSTQYWYELNPPSPFSIRVYGQKPKLEFERMGPGTMAAVPPSHWFHAGDLPTASVATTPPLVRPAPGGTPMITPVAGATARPTAPTETRSGQFVTVPESRGNDIRD